MDFCQLLFQEHIDIIEPLKNLYQDYFGGNIQANLIIDCENLFQMIKHGCNDKTPKNVNRAIIEIQQNLKAKILNNVCRMSGLENPADPLTKHERAQIRTLNSLMNTQTLAAISNFEWMKF